MRKKFFSFLILVLMSGFFTPFSQARAVNPILGYTTSIDIYLDAFSSVYQSGQAFNWTSATRAYAPLYGNCSGARDFVFNCAVADSKKIACTVSNDLYYTTPWYGNSPIYFEEDGWHTFKHSFYDDGTGQLLVRMEIIKDGVVKKMWEFNTTDRIGIDVAGPRHGWFSVNNLSSPLGYSRLPIDNSNYCDNDACFFEQGFETDASGWFSSINGRYPYRVANSESAFLAASGNYYAMASYDSFTAWGDDHLAPRNDCTWPNTVTPARDAAIISPVDSQVVTGSLSIEAELYNDNSDDGLDWWVKTGECAISEGDIKAGNIGLAVSSVYAWNNNLLTATVDASAWAPGNYCFIFDPKESGIETDIRLSQDFSVIDNLKPEVVITTPEDGAEIKGAVNIQASAADANLASCRLAVKTVENEVVKDVFFQIYTASECTAGINYPWDTNTALTPDGSYTIAFQAFDSSYVDDTSLNNWHEDVHVVTVKNTVVVTPPKDICLRPYDKDDCKKGGWKFMKGYGFQNQGECVSFLESAFNANGCKY